MKINVLILGVLLGLAALWTGYSTGLSPQFSAQQNSDKIIDLVSAPNFTYSTIEGKKGELSDHSGKTVLLHFWASWCAPCIVEFPSLIKLASQKQENLIILAVSTDTQKAEINKFLNRIKTNVPENFIIIQDGDKRITQDLYQTIKLPETYVITADQKIAEKLIGPQENWVGFNFN